MTHVAIPTLQPDIRLEIQNLGSSDIRFGVDSNSFALARIGNSSIFSSYKADRHLQSFFMEMMKSEDITFPVESEPFEMFEEMPITVVSFSTDDPQVYAAVLKTADNIVGIQTFRENWKDFGKEMPIAWMGVCDKDSNSSRQLNKIYTQCHDILYPTWARRTEPAKIADRRIISLKEAMQPEIPKWS